MMDSSIDADLRSPT